MKTDQYTACLSKRVMEELVDRSQVSRILQYITFLATKSIHIIILELMNLLHGNKFSPWEDFFVRKENSF